MTKFKGISFRITTLGGYPAKIIVLVNSNGVMFIYQRFLIPIEEYNEFADNGWVHLRTSRNKCLVQRELGFRDSIFTAVLTAWAGLMDEWHDDGQLNIPEDENATQQTTKFTTWLT